MPSFAFQSNSFENPIHPSSEWRFAIAIDLRKLRHVVETARFENVTRAAEALYITQSALTRSLADVEAELGTPLFVRLPRGVRVTDQGRRFVDRARLIIGDVGDLLADIQCPTLVVHCKGDRMIQSSAGIDLSKRIPQAKLALIDSDDHWWFTENADAILKAARPFLDRPGI